MGGAYAGGAAVSGNRYKIEIELPSSDGFHTQGDLYLAEVVQRRVQEFRDDPVQIEDCTAHVMMERLHRARGDGADTEGPAVNTVEAVDAFVEQAHAGQVDKIGVPYVEHVRAVAAGLVPFGPDLVMAGLLHDVLEDTEWTAEGLREAGVPERTLIAVEAVTNAPGVSYEAKIRRITRDPDAVLVKIADNAHNSRADRAAQLTPEQRKRLAAKYRAARKVLWAMAAQDDVRAIVAIVNPDLLVEIGAAYSE